MALPSRLGRRDKYRGPTGDLLASHQIGLILDKDFTYDLEARQGHSTQRAAAGWKAEDGKDLPRVQNFAVLTAYGKHCNKIFIHGKDLLSEAQAKQVFEQHIAPEQLMFSEQAMEKAAWAFRPDSLKGRLTSYVMRNNPTDAEVIELEIKALQEHYTHIDLSALPRQGSMKQDEYLAVLLKKLEESGVNTWEMSKMQRDGKSHSDFYMQRLLEKDMPKALDTFLGAPKDAAQQAFCARLGGDLRSYMQAHHWDWEILENFKTGMQAAKPQDSLQELLEAGIRVRAKALLCDAVKQMANPYSEQFAAAERGMAYTLKDSLQPRTLDLLMRAKTPVIFINGPNLLPAQYIFGGENYAQGMFSPESPRDQGFSEGLFISEPTLSLTWKMQTSIRHEMEHWLDLKSEQYFAEKHMDKLPDMIKSDLKSLGLVYQELKKVTPESSEADKARVFRLGRKRGIRGKPEELEKLRDELADDIGRINSFTKRFAPDPGKESIHYDHAFKKFSEIPAVLEEVKALYGQNFVEVVLPQLSKLTHEHRVMAYEALEAKYPAKAVGAARA